MKFDSPISLKELFLNTEAEIVGDTSLAVRGINEIHLVEEGDLVFVDHPKYYEKALKSKASYILIDKKVDETYGKTIIVTPLPFKLFNDLIKKHTPFQEATSLIHSSFIKQSGTIIQPNVIIGPHVSIGKNCIIHANVVIYEHVHIGDGVIIHANTVIGSDAFYYNKKQGVYSKFNTCGRVIIENDVEIGASCTIDRGITGDTVIGQGTKMDNQVHVGHDTVIGKNCLFAAQVAIAGICTIEDNVTLWGQVGINSKVTIGKNAVVLGQSGISKSIEGNKTYFGSPAGEATKKMRELVSLQHLPEKLNQLK